jgi:hypothetical protein
MSFRKIALLLTLPFIGGALITGWAIKQYDLFGSEAVVVASPAPTSVQSERLIAPPPIDDSSALAPGNSARTEGMLIASAARRAIDAGQPLGYVSDQLRLRFGGSQPQNVATLLSASARPVTLANLQSDLESIGDLLLSRSKSTGLLLRIQREMNELFVLRKEGTLSTAPSQRLLRAKKHAANGNIAAAISEVQKMPGAARGLDWLTKAGSYVSAHKALDAIERAAATAPEALPEPKPLAPLLPTQADPEQSSTPALETPILQAPAE